MGKVYLSLFYLLQILVLLEGMLEQSVECIRFAGEESLFGAGVCGKDVVTDFLELTASVLKILDPLEIIAREPLRRETLEDIIEAFLGLSHRYCFVKVSQCNSPKLFVPSLLSERVS